MLPIINYIVIALAILLLIVLIIFIWYSYAEEQKRAVNRGLLCLSVFIIVVFGTTFLPEHLLLFFLVVPIAATVLFVPCYGNQQISFKIPQKQFDERDVMFSRNTLKENSAKFNSYYTMRPENREPDNAFRKEPGLLQNGAMYYNQLLFEATHATFQTVDLLQPMVEGNSNPKKANISEKELSDFIEQWTVKLGALNVGFTKIKTHHIYSHVGRGEAYGEPIDLNHEFAIAFTVEMSHESLRYNPKGPVVMESAKQYLNAGKIAIQVAQFLRNLGYEARAHIDANYRLICPIVAQDAGLGVIGRMGLLMTPDLGPRVRIGVVSTNLQLPVSEKVSNSSHIHFCEACKKCAENCPSQAISKTSIKNNKHPERWTINQEKCFAYWCKVGTDCGRCVSVCPYSHPNNAMHNVVRWFIARNPINRYVALKLDDFFYGKKPKPQKLKSWMETESN